MSFWTTSDNSALQATGTMEMNEPIEPIPNGTQVKAAMDEVKWDEYEGDSFISARWVVLDGEYKNRKIFHKIRVKDLDSKKRDKALRMLAAIDTNAGGMLMKSPQEPDDMMLAHALMNRPMVLKLGVWEMDDRKGNWVQAVAPINGAAVQQAQAPVAAAAPVAPTGDVPF